MRTFGTFGTCAGSADLAHELGAVAKADTCRARTKGEKVAGVKIGLLGSGFGMAHARIYHGHPDVDEVVVFGRTTTKL